jgi:FKBP-type peptidyl-prolyl cis-trans isomerase (trigger factor)
MSKYNAKITKLPKSSVSIEAEIDATIFESYREKAVKHMGEHLEVDGFRKGKAPEAVILKHIPEMAILEEMANDAIADHYIKILEEEKIDAIGRPEVTITKIAKDNPLSFKITTATVPEVTLPDYKKIAKKEGKKVEVKVEEKEVEDTLLTLRREHALRDKGPEFKREDLKDEDLPVEDDEFAKKLGAFENIAGLKTKIEENIKLEKEGHEREKNRLTIIEAILKDTKIEIPDLLVESELDKMLYKMESDITSMGLGFDDYLTHLKKSKEDLRNEFRADAEKRATIEMVIHEIAKIEKIVPDAEAVKKEVAHILDMYKDADAIRAQVYVETLMISQEVWKLLENQGE